MDLLAARPHFRRELAAKLAARGYEDDEIEATLDHLESKGFLDDGQTARDFVERRLEREPLGRRRLAAELARHGASEDDARQAVDAFYPEDDRALAAAAAERWRRRSPGKGATALARHLERRGFSQRAIVAILQDAAADAGVE